MVSNIVLSAMAWVSSLRTSIVEAIREEGGQDLIEYAVLAGAIGVAAAVALFALGPDVFTDFRDTVQACITFDEAGCVLP